MSGWIKIYRQIDKHWVWENESYFKAWITILLRVNFEDRKTLVSGELIDCKRGQSLYSLKTWAKIFGKNWTIQRVRTFFELLKKEHMINTEGLQKTTRLTVLNYDSYQNEQQTNNTQKSFESTHKQHTDNTQITSTKEGKEGKEVKEEREIVDLWNMICSPSLSKVEKLTKSRKGKISIRIKEIGGKPEIKKLFLKIKDSKFLNGDNVKNWKATFDWVFENDKNWVKITEGNYDNKSPGFNAKNPTSQPTNWKEF